MLQDTLRPYGGRVAIMIDYDEPMLRRPSMGQGTPGSFAWASPSWAAAAVLKGASKSRAGKSSKHASITQGGPAEVVTILSVDMSRVDEERTIIEGLPLAPACPPAPMSTHPPA